MWLRILLCLALALVAISLTQVWGANSADSINKERVYPENERAPISDEYDFKDRKPIPRPSEVLGWVLVRVCSITGRLDHRFSEYAYVRPTFIIAIGNPPTSPDPCIALHGASGRRIYVEGTMEAMARYIMDTEDAQ